MPDIVRSKNCSIEKKVTTRGEKAYILSPRQQSLYSGMELTKEEMNSLLDSYEYILEIKREERKEDV